MHVDLHNHTVLCHHASGTVDEYVARAAELGIDEFGFAEHSYWMLRHDKRNLCPSRHEMDVYLRWMDDARRRYDGKSGGPIVRVGLEADWVPERLDEARAFIASYPFDYIIGSVHHLIEPTTGKLVCAWWFETTELEVFYRAYFSEIEKLALSGMCDIIAHLDVPVRSKKVPAGGVLPFVEEILPALRRADVAVEINTSGLDHPNKSFFPARDILKRLVDVGIPITFGSDGHAVAQLGRYREEARRLLAECGAKTFVRFEGRRRIEVPLES